MISARQMIKGIYSDVLICIEEAFWDFLFLCTIYISACMWKSREGPLSWRARHRNWGWGHVEHALRHAKWQGASTHTHLHSGWLLSAAQRRHLLFTVLPRVHCRRGHHSERYEAGLKRMESFRRNLLPHCTFHSGKRARALPNGSRSYALFA